MGRGVGVIRAECICVRWVLGWFFLGKYVDANVMICGRERLRGIGAAEWKGYVCIRLESCSGERGYVESAENEGGGSGRCACIVFIMTVTCGWEWGTRPVQVRFYMLIYDYCNVARGRG